jgi:hypothetical protein
MIYFPSESYIESEPQGILTQAGHWVSQVSQLSFGTESYLHVTRPQQSTHKTYLFRNEVQQSFNERAGVFDY